MLLRGRRRRRNDGCASAGEARLAVEGRGDEAADGGSSHGPKLPAAAAPGPCFLNGAEATVALAPSHRGARSRSPRSHGWRSPRAAELAPTSSGARARGCPRSRGQRSSGSRPTERRLTEPAPSPLAAASRAEGRSHARMKRMKSLSGVSRCFQRFGKNAHSFRPIKRFPSLSSSIHAKALFLLMCHLI